MRYLVRDHADQKQRCTARSSSAYCGGLHVAALRVSLEMARLMGDTAAIAEYDNWLTLAKKSYSDKLWNGKYYNYDSSNSRHHDSIMSDQLAGFWYLRLSGQLYEVSFTEDDPFTMDGLTLCDGRISRKNV